MGDIIWGVLLVVFGIVVTAQGWVLYRNPEEASRRMQRDGAASFQPSWAVKRLTPGNMRARALSMFVGGPTFVVLGALLLAEAK